MADGENLNGLRVEDEKDMYEPVWTPTSSAKMGANGAPIDSQRFLFVDGPVGWLRLLHLCTDRGILAKSRIQRLKVVGDPVDL